MSSSSKKDRSSSGGRPRKFAEPSRPITLTLPESTLASLSRIDPDRGRAIVKLAESTLSRERPPVEVVEMAPDTGLLVVSQSQALRRIPFLRLIEVAPGRFLLVLKSGHDFRSLELALQDVLEDLSGSDVEERSLLEDLLEKVRHLRKSERVSMGEILFVSLA